MEIPILRKILQKSWFWALVVFSVSLSIYLFTLSPTIGLEDSAEFITAAGTLGIAHPPGYPLYILLGKLFTFIPLGDIAWRLNLMSAIFGSLTVAILFLVIDHILKILTPFRGGSRKTTQIKTLRLHSGQAQNNTKDFYTKLIAVVVSLIFAFTPTFWSQVIIAEVYTLNTFFVSLTILLLLKFFKEKNFKYLYWFSFVYGLSLTNHQMMILLAPVYLFFILLVDKKVFNHKTIIINFLLVILGLSAYLYLPLRSLQNPRLDWGNPENLHNFWAHILRKQYNDFGLIVQNQGSKLLLINSFFSRLIGEFSIPGTILGFAGLFLLLFHKKWKIIILFLGIFLMNSLAIIIFRKYGWGIGVEYTYQVYWLPAYLMVSIWLSLGLFFGLQEIGKIKNKLFISLIILLLLLPINNLIGNWQKNNKSDFWLVCDWGFEALKSLEPQAILIVKESGFSQDTQLFSLSYWQMMRNFRKDVLIVDDAGVFSQTTKWIPQKYFELPFEEQREALTQIFWQYSYDKKRPLYTTYPVKGIKELSFRSNGIVYKIFASRDAAKKAEIKNNIFGLRNLDEKRFERDYALQDFLSRFYYAQSALYLEQGEKKHSQETLIKAINFDNEPFSLNYKAFVAHRNYWLEE